jgi:hypothetical protein
MDEKTFWRTTLRKLMALLEVHIRIMPKYSVDGEETTTDEPTEATNADAIFSIMKW